MSLLDFGIFDINGTLNFEDFDSDGLTYEAEAGVIDTGHLSLTVERTEGGVRIVATDPRGASEGIVYDGYTPEKGLDYFTPEEIAEIENAVVARVRVTYTHNQMQASDFWEINHNLGKHPAVTVVDSAGNAILGEVRYISENSLAVEFSAPFSGKAYLN